MTSKQFAVIHIGLLLLLIFGFAIFGQKPTKNIEHDGHLFIQSNNSLIHHPAFSCQSSLKAIRASK